MAEYFFNSLNPTSFQRLVGAVLVARFGEAVRLGPLRGKDGGRDAEATVAGEDLEIWTADVSTPVDPTNLRPGRYMFQAKFHRTLDSPLASARSSVISDLSREVNKNVIASLPQAHPITFSLSQMFLPAKTLSLPLRESVAP